MAVVIVVAAVAVTVVTVAVAEVLIVVVVVSHYNSRNGISPAFSSFIILVPPALPGKFTHNDFWEFPRVSHKLLPLRIAYHFLPIID